MWLPYGCGGNYSKFLIVKVASSPLKAAAAMKDVLEDNAAFTLKMNHKVQSDSGSLFDLHVKSCKW